MLYLRYGDDPSEFEAMVGRGKKRCVGAEEYWELYKKYIVRVRGYSKALKYLEKASSCVEADRIDNAKLVSQALLELENGKANAERRAEESRQWVQKHPTMPAMGRLAMIRPYDWTVYAPPISEIPWTQPTGESHPVIFIVDDGCSESNQKSQAQK